MKTPLACALLASLLAAPLLAQGPPPPPPPLPAMPVPAQNPITPAKAALGKILFFDEQLSSSGTVACATCHIPSANGTDPRIGINPGIDGIFGTPDDKHASPGVQASDANNDFVTHPNFGVAVQVTRRTAPTMINAGYAPLLFWDGRAGGAFADPETGVVLIPNGATLESQAVKPILADAEMAHTGRNFANVVQKLRSVKPLALATNLPADLATRLASNPSYEDLFAAAFGTADVTAARIGMALATYERQLVSNQTPYDRHLAGVVGALTQNQLRGLNVFRTNGRCAVCHQEPFLTDHSFRNVGLRPIAEDEGRFEITNNPADRGRFKVPALRNGALKATFMHNGQFTTLTEVVDFYARRGDFAANQDPVMAAINLPPQDRQALVDFLTNALLDPRVAAEQAPFDRPTLGMETGTILPTEIGPGSVASNGRSPKMLATAPAKAPNPDFRVGLGEVRADEAAWLALSPLAAAPGTILGGLPIGLHVLTPGFGLLPVPLAGTGPTDGVATFDAPLPDDVSLSGLTIYAQWLVSDRFHPAGAAVSAPVAIAIW